MTSQKASCWSITINNPTPEEIEGLKQLPEWVRKWEGQVEKGENGTEHIQGMLKTQHVRFSQVKKLMPRAHIEVARNEKALAKYVHKEDTRVDTLATTTNLAIVDIARGVREVWNSHAEWKAMLNKQYDDYDNEYPDSQMAERAKCKLNIGEWTLDCLIKHYINNGYSGIEYMGANPAVRLAWKKFYKEILTREFKKIEVV